VSEKTTPMIAPRPNEDGEEQRFREAMDRLAGQMLQTLDASISLRTAAPDTQRSRHLARGHLLSFLLHSLNTYHLHQAQGPVRQKPRSA